MMIRPATQADLPAVAALYEAIFDREDQGPVYTNWQRGTYPTIDTARGGPGGREPPCRRGKRRSLGGGDPQRGAAAGV